MLYIIEQLPQGLGTSPRWRVRCPDCGATYVLTGWRKDVERKERCAECARKARAKK